ncbi:MAG: LPS export ABC transporter permease LptG [Pseudomonadales bacterium]|nr:LPS export ABC transporter permease LptG [Pseudomonadales bacterium]
MIKIDRYISRTVVLAMLLVLLVLASLDLVFTLFDEIGDTGDRYRSMDALLYVLLTFPRHLYELLPMAALMGALVGLGVMASSNELVIMRAAGVRVSRIVWAVMKPTALVMVAGLVLGEFMAPPLELRAEVHKALANADGGEMILSRYGHWLREGEAYMHFNAIEADGVLHGVSIYRFDAGKQLVSSTFAEKAVYQQQGSWLLENVSESVFVETDGQSKSFNTFYIEKTWAVDLVPELLRVLIMDPDKMAISDLYRYARRFETQGQDGNQYYLAFWKKMLQPLTTAVLVLVAIAFVFGPLREATMGSRVFVAICFGLLFIILQRLLNTLSLVFQLDPLLAVLLPILLTAVAGSWLLRRAA